MEARLLWEADFLCTRAGSLRIERVLFSDGGMYTCIATNSGGTITSVISLEVRGESIENIEKTKIFVFKFINFAKT